MEHSSVDIHVTAECQVPCYDLHLDDGWVEWQLLRTTLNPREANHMWSDKISVTSRGQTCA
jgi:hypothetical protein